MLQYKLPDALTISAKTGRGLPALVERVLENMEVYKNRLAGRDMPLTILADLYAPASPPDQPVLTPTLKPSARPKPN